MGLFDFLRKPKIDYDSNRYYQIRKDSFFLDQELHSLFLKRGDRY
jgi:hypothetical protein